VLRCLVNLTFHQTPATKGPRPVCWTSNWPQPLGFGILQNVKLTKRMSTIMGDVHLPNGHFSFSVTEFIVNIIITHAYWLTDWMRDAQSAYALCLQGCTHHLHRSEREREPFQLSLMCVSKAGAYPSEATFRCSSLGYAPGLTNRHYPKLEKLARDRHFGLLLTFINNALIFSDIVPRPRDPI
jgi:hypothetical protein